MAEILVGTEVDDLVSTGVVVVATDEPKLIQAIVRSWSGLSYHHVGVQLQGSLVVQANYHIQAAALELLSSNEFRDGGSYSLHHITKMKPCGINISAVGNQLDSNIVRWVVAEIVEGQSICRLDSKSLHTLSSSYLPRPDYSSYYK